MAPLQGVRNSYRDNRGQPLNPFELTKRTCGLLVNYSRIAILGSVGAAFTKKDRLTLAQAVIVDGDRVLLAVRSDLWGWELPGGAVERGESPEEAVRREVREETGLDVAVERRVGRYVRTGFRPHTALVFRCRVVGGELHTNWEALCARWFPTDALPETLFPWYADPLQDALSESEDEVERHDHQGLDEILAGMHIDLRMRFGDALGEVGEGSVTREPRSSTDDA